MLGPDADIEKILDSNMNDMCEYNLILLGDRVISLKNNHSMPSVWQDNMNFNYLLTLRGLFPLRHYTMKYIRFSQNVFTFSMYCLLLPVILDGIETSSELSTFENDLMREIDLPGIAENIQPPPSPVESNPSKIKYNCFSLREGSQKVFERKSLTLKRSEAKK